MVAGKNHQQQPSLGETCQRVFFAIHSRQLEVGRHIADRKRLKAGWIGRQQRR